MKSNDELQKDVMDEIRWDPQLKEVGAQIGVTAKEGVITLSGLVNSLNEKLAAEKAAQRVAGVKVVAVDIVVAINRPHEKTDAEIAEAIKNALTWHSAVNEDRIEIKVDNGWVYLEGNVQWDYEKKAAENAVQNLIGVRGITNRISVSAKSIDPVDIKKHIASAFLRSATIDSSGVEVETSGSKVTLKGKVRSWMEKQDAENVAWSMPGVLEVNNQIEVDTEILV
ncbi:MAG TPA: BON domain-containing protein [Cyclobacteriaceae bacterium]|nr:BON domain-containing protein [Cyclobacteriaceae bacterium]